MKPDILTSSFIDLREKLHHIALRYLQNDEDAKDVVQDTWLRIKLKSSVSNSEEAKNKLICVLRNVCIDKLRKKKLKALDDIIVPSALQYEMEVDDIKTYEKLLQKGLTPLQQQIFNLIIHDGYDYEQIAKELSLTVEAVRMNMSRARKKIRETYKKIER